MNNEKTDQAKDFYAAYDNSSANDNDKKKPDLIKEEKENYKRKCRSNMVRQNKCTFWGTPIDWILLIFYLASIIVLPVYNYKVMTDKFKYPLTFTALQLLSTAIVCGIWNLVLSFLLHCRQTKERKKTEAELNNDTVLIDVTTDISDNRNNGSDNNNYNNNNNNNNNGSHLLEDGESIDKANIKNNKKQIEEEYVEQIDMKSKSKKTRYNTTIFFQAVGGNHRKIFIKWGMLLVPAVLFAINISCNNVATVKTSATLAILLKATSIVWTILLNWAILKFKPPVAGIICIVFIFAGIICVVCSSLIGEQKNSKKNVTEAIVMVLVSAILSSVYMIVMKVIQIYLNIKQSIMVHPTESTTVVMGTAAILMFCLSAIIEKGAWTELKEKIPDMSTGVFRDLIVGIILTLVSKISNIWLLLRQSVFNLSIVGEIKMVPQILLDTLLIGKYQLNALSIVGAVVIIVSQVTWGFLSPKVCPNVPASLQKLLLEKNSCLYKKTSKEKSINTSESETDLLANPLESLNKAEQCKSNENV